MSRSGTLGGTVAGVVILLLAVAACGLPQEDGANGISEKDVPYGLLQPAPQATALAPTSTQQQDSRPTVYLVDAQQRLEPVAAPVAATMLAVPTEEAQYLLRVLQVGPTEQQRSRGLSTALSPGVTIEVLAVRSGIATVEIKAQLKDPSADRLPLAIGQVVLTVTSVPGLRGVQLVRDSIPLEVPLPGGALTSLPLTRADYAELTGPAVAARSAPSPSTTATP